MTPRADHAVTAPTLRRALISGAQRVIAGRERLNRINVFPVADGDTGNNLAFTLGGLLNGALRQRSGHLGALLQRVSEEAIDGARGNSGAILAQFLHGVAEHARGHPVLEAGDLAAAVGHGARQARAALSDPVEGTILSVIDRFAEALAVAGDAAHATPRLAFAHALGEARTALARTPEQMPLLRMAGVVDAGA
ncbi:MAG: DAK2 domain-containing protein, partial [Luteimonas sp.]